MIAEHSKENTRDRNRRNEGYGSGEDSDKPFALRRVRFPLLSMKELYEIERNQYMKHNYLLGQQ